MLVLYFVYLSLFSEVQCLSLFSLAGCRSTGRPHGDGHRDRCSHRLHALHPPQRRLLHVSAAPTPLRNARVASSVSMEAELSRNQSERRLPVDRPAVLFLSDKQSEPAEYDDSLIND